MLEWSPDKIYIHLESLNYINMQETNKVSIKEKIGYALNQCHGTMEYWNAGILGLEQ